MMAAPLLASTDPEATDPEDLRILMNPDVLAVDQDPLGVPAEVVDRGRRVWTLRRPLVDGRAAVSFTNVGRRTRSVERSLVDLGILGPGTRPRRVVGRGPG